MKIGIKTKNIMKTLDEGVESDVIELISNDHAVGFKLSKLVELKKVLEGKDLSMHSQMGRVFESLHKHGNPDFIEVELDILRAEVVLCKFLGAKELIFHLRTGKLTDDEIKHLKKVLDFAKENSVEMIYESNYDFEASDVFYMLEKFPELNYNLDLGHVNVAFHKEELGMGIEDFVSKLGDRVVYVHAHNNDGKFDSHRGLAHGVLDWKRVLDSLDFKNVKKVIAEVWDTGELLETKKLLEEYFDE